MLARRQTSWARLGWLIGALAIGTWAVSLGGVIFWEHRDTARPASAIVVMGAAQYVGHPSPVLRARLDHALDLWRKGFAPRLIFTGGFGEGDTTSEAAVGRRYAMQRGVPSGAILIENRGRSTTESMQQVSRLMEAEPTREVILVSDPFHMLRLSIIARRYGLIPYSSPTRTSPISMNRHEAWHYTLGESIKVPLTFFLERREP
jgi:uncharacterized SAM-binding protein YcdF (DUF218 family)